jgi:hypothetical protein
MWWTHNTGHFFRVNKGVPSTATGAEDARGHELEVVDEAQGTAHELVEVVIR